MPLLKCVPDTNPALGGLQVLSHVNRENLAKQYKMKDNMDLVKHIVNLHDGEVRQVGEESWVEFPACGGDDIFKACFWHYQAVMEDGAPK